MVNLAQKRSTSDPLSEMMGEEVKLLTDNGPCRKQKLVLTAFLLMSFFGLGMTRAQDGVAFLDLLIILHESLRTGSFLFLLTSLGCIVGALSGGLLHDICNSMVIFSSSLMFMGLFSFVIPFCSSLVLMGSVLFFRSLFGGAVDAGGTYICIRMWRNQANPYVQALHFVYALGALAVPFFTAPFLSARHENKNNNNASLVVDLDIYPISENNEDATVYNDGNHTLVSAKHCQLGATQGTDIYISFLIVGAFIMVIFVLFLIWNAITPRESRSEIREHLKIQMANCPRQELEEDSKIIPLIYNIAMYSLIVLLYWTLGCFETSSSTFFMPFVVEYIQWNKVKAAHLMAFYWGSFAASRLFAIALGKITTEIKMLIVDFVLLMGGFCLLLLIYIETEIVVWCSVVIVGFAQGGLFPTVAAWLTAKCFPLAASLVVSSLYLLAGEACLLNL